MVERRGPKPTRTEVLESTLKRKAANSSGRLRAGGQFVTKTAKSLSISSGTAASKKEWNDSRAYLTKSSLKNWLSSSENMGAQIDLMKSMLDTQLDYLETKSDLKADAYRVASGELNQMLSAANVQTNPPQNNSNQIEQGRELKKIIANLDSDLEQDQTRHAQALKLRTALQALSGNSRNSFDEHEMASAISQFMKVQSGETYDSDAPAPSIDASRDKFVEFLMKDAPKRYRDLRGKLIETELQSTRLRNQSSTAATSA